MLKSKFRVKFLRQFEKPPTDQVFFFFSLLFYLLPSLPSQPPPGLKWLTRFEERSYYRFLYTLVFFFFFA